jgi:uncharacterized protein YuzE
VRIFYDDQSDSLYVKLSDDKPDGVIEITDAIKIDTSSNNKLVGLEILNASEYFDLDSCLIDDQNELISMLRSAEPAFNDWLNEEDQVYDSL